MQRLRESFVKTVGGVKPYKAFTFDRYDVTSDNRLALEHARRFDPSKHNLYLWGPCGVGKTHLAVAILRQCFGRGASAAFVTVPKLIRSLRMKAPEDEQQVIERFTSVNVLVLDDLGVGTDTPFAQQVLQEVLDGRDFRDRCGLVITSQFSPVALTARLHNRAISSRLVGMCAVIEMRGIDRRQMTAIQQS